MEVSVVCGVVYATEGMADAITTPRMGRMDAMVAGIPLRGAFILVAMKQRHRNITRDYDGRGTRVARGHRYFHW